MKQKNKLIEKIESIDQHHYNFYVNVSLMRELLACKAASTYLFSSAMKVASIRGASADPAAYLHHVHRVRKTQS
jgi:hypothetical protein